MSTSISAVTPAAEAATSAAPARLSPAEVRRGLRISTIEGALATINISITGAIGGSVFLTGFALLLGADSFQLGMLGALPFIGQIFQFVGAYLEERLGNRRGLVLYGALGGRLIWALLLALPFLSFLSGAQLLIFFLGLACSYALNGIAGNAWLSWMSDLVPPNQRGRYFGVRNTVAGIATMATTYVAGMLLDNFRAQGGAALGYAVIFGIALLAAIGSAMLVARQPEPPLQPKGGVRIADLISGPLHDRPFRSYVLVATGWALVTGVASPFFNAFGLSTLNLSFSFLALMAIVTSVVSLIFTPLLGQWMDKHGHRRVLLICLLGTVPLPWGWVLSTPDNLIPLWLTSICSGVFWPGVNQGLVNILMDRAPADRRGAAMASHSAVTGIGTLTAGLLGGAIAAGLGGATLALGPIILTNMSILFALSSLGRALMVGAFWRTL